MKPANEELGEQSTAQMPREKTGFVAQVGLKAARKRRARRDSGEGVWFGLGMMGLIGWSVVVPTLLGAALGVWLDQRYPGGRSWTLALLMGGLGIGCLNAWRWLGQEHRAMHDQAQTLDEGEQADE